MFCIKVKVKKKKKHSNDDALFSAKWQTSQPPLTSPLISCNDSNCLSRVNSTKRRLVTPVTKPRVLTLKSIGYAIPMLHAYNDLLAAATFGNQLNYRIIRKMFMLLRVPKHLPNSTIYNHGASLAKQSSSKKTYCSKQCTVVLYCAMP